MSKLAGRYRHVGFSWAGGGTTYYGQDDPTLLRNVPPPDISPGAPVSRRSITSTLSLHLRVRATTCGVRHHRGTPSYIHRTRHRPKMRETSIASHAGQPS